MLAIVRIALRRPYTFIVAGLLILLVGTFAALRMPVDIFPSINIPIIGVAWQYQGLPPDQMAGRIITPFERSLTTTVGLISEHFGGRIRIPPSASSRSSSTRRLTSPLPMRRSPRFRRLCSSRCRPVRRRR